MSALQHLLAHNFDADEEFRRGLQIILSRAKPGSLEENPTEATQVLLKAKLFFFNKRTGSNITLEEYTQALERDTSGNAAVAQLETKAPAAPQDDMNSSSEKNLTFAEIKHLIETGQAHLIPHNKTIPDQLNDAQPSVSQIQAKKKPWEINSSTAIPS